MNEIFVKDFDYCKFIKRFNEYKEIVEEMKTKINNNFSCYLVDLMIKSCKVGDKTCVDVRYHLDGDYKKDNEYCIYCEGPNRTIFCDEKIDFSSFPDDRNLQNKLLESLLKDKPCYEIPEKYFFVYDSKKPHKGVVCKKTGTRTFIRMMGSNYIKPKNYVKNNA
jgi:hypothetical protein